MPEEIQFEEAKKWPRCPFCDETLDHIEFTRQKLKFGFMSGFTWVVLLQCPTCAKVLGTQDWS